MMKALLFLTFIVLIFKGAVAQDTIMLANGSMVRGKVLEVGVTRIKYKKQDDTTGRTYNVHKNLVLEALYKNGTRDIFNTPQTILANAEFKKANKLARNKIAGGRVMIIIGAPALLSGAMLFTAPARATGNVSERGNTRDLIISGTLCLALGIALESTGPLLLIKGLNERKRAKEIKATIGFNPIIDSNLDRYNQTINQNKLGTLSFTF